MKVHFDGTMNMIADSLYYIFVQRLRGFENCNAPKLYRHFVRGKGMISVDGRDITVVYPRRAHNPILRALPWQEMPDNIPSLPGARLTLLNFPDIFC